MTTASRAPDPGLFDMTPPLDPLLKWAGGKRWQTPLLRPLWEPHAARRFVEPCCGALGMTLGLRPARALLNDRNPHLMNFHRWVQRGLRVDLPMAYDEALYYAHRDRFNALAQGPDRESREAASLFYYLNRTGFNGLCRFNARGAFNVPFGQYTTITYTRDFTAYQPVLAAWTLSTGDFETVALDADDFVYADPPYDVAFTDYAEGGFAWADQERLVRWLVRHPGPVVLVNQATPRIVALYTQAGFHVRTLEAPRRINRTGDRTPAAEVLATRNV